MIAIEIARISVSLIPSKPNKGTGYDEGTSSDLTPQIAKRAYELYEKRGRQDGHGKEKDWKVKSVKFEKMNFLRNLKNNSLEIEKKRKLI